MDAEALPAGAFGGLEAFEEVEEGDWGCWGGGRRGEAEFGKSCVVYR